MTRGRATAGTPWPCAPRRVFRSAGAGHRLGDDPDHRVRLVEAGVGMAGPVLAVVVDTERPVVLVTEGRVVAQGAGVRVDVGHVAAVVPVVARSGHEVVVEEHPRGGSRRGG